MPRIDFTGLRDELVLENLPTRKHPEGKDYTVQDVTQEDAQRLLEIYSLIESPDDAEKRKGAKQFAEFLTVDGKTISLLHRLLGDSAAQIEADGLGSEVQKHLEQTLIRSALSGVEAAQAALIAEVAAGEAAARGNRATRRAAAKKSTPSSRKAGSNTTRRTASRSTARSSSATPARTSGQGSTRSRATSARSTASAPARKAG